jgi:hypothetical protein
MLRPVGCAAALAVWMILPVSGQWLKIPAPNVPRGADGKPDLSAPAPRRADGKPDLSGVWNPNPKYLVNLAADMKPEEVPLQPWSLALYNERKEGKHSKEEPDANCQSQGVPKIDAAPAPYKFVQLPGLVIILYEAFTQFRQVFMDGRGLPKDPNPTWLGYSVGKWDGDTLVVESAGFNGKAWLDQEGHPLTDALHVTERFRRRDFGHMDLDVTIDDPKAYTKPWSAKENLTLMPDGELLEFVCQENEKDIRHMLNK